MATNLVCKINKHFASVTDPRVNRGMNYDLVEMIFMALTATLYGAQGWMDIRQGSAPEISSAIRRMALNILQ